MKAIVVGATGTIGGAVADALAARGHHVVRASRSGEPPVDVVDPATVDALLAAAGPVDAVVCCAASAPLTRLTDLSDEDYARTLHAKLPDAGTPVRDVARSYVEAVEETAQGAVLVPRVS